MAILKKEIGYSIDWNSLSITQECIFSQPRQSPTDWELPPEMARYPYICTTDWVKFINISHLHTVIPQTRLCNGDVWPTQTSFYLKWGA